MAAEPLPGDYPRTLKRGDSREWQHTFTVTDSDPVQAYDLSGRTWLAQIRATLDPDSPLMATLTVDSSDAANGVITVTLPASEARNLTGSSAYWDLEATLIADPEDVRTWVEGEVEILGDASRSA